VFSTPGFTASPSKVKPQDGREIGVILKGMTCTAMEVALFASGCSLDCLASLRRISRIMSRLVKN
jgi:hypothetical protein